MVNDTVNLYYTNAGSIQFAALDPKLVVAAEALTSENIDLLSIPETGLRWTKPITNIVKR